MELPVANSKEEQLGSLLLMLEDGKPSTAVFRLVQEWLYAYSNFSNSDELDSQLDLFTVFFSLLSKLGKKSLKN